jgi:hypothetical protein
VEPWTLAFDASSGAGLLRFALAAVERKVELDAGEMPRSRAVTFNILEAAETLIQEAPESAAVRPP